MATQDELIQWLRTTTPERVPQETLDHLRAGVALDDLWAAGARALSGDDHTGPRGLVAGR